MQAAQEIPDLLTEADAPMSQTALREAIKSECACGKHTAMRAIEHATTTGLIVGVRQGTHVTAPILYHVCEPPEVGQLRL